MHILQGEWDLYLWGTQYQGIPGTALLAGAFRLFGTSPYTWILTLLVGYSLLVLTVYSVLRTRLGRGHAFLLVVPILLAHQGLTRHIMVPFAFSVLCCNLACGYGATIGPLHQGTLPHCLLLLRFRLR